MWVSDDGHRLTLSAARADRLARAADRLGLAAPMRACRSGNQTEAVACAVGQLVRRARCVGEVRGPRTGQLYSVFEAVAGAQPFRLWALPAGARDRGGRILAVAAVDVDRGDREDGDGARIANLDVLRAIWGIDAGLPFGQVMAKLEQAARMTRGGMQQVNAHHAPNPAAKPDRSYISARTGQRVNVEVDTDPNSAAAHLRNLARFDPTARNYALIVNQFTGQVIGAMIQGAHGKAPREIKDPASLKRLIDSLPKARQAADPAGKKVDRQSKRRPLLPRVKPAAQVARAVRGKPSASKGRPLRNGKHREREQEWQAARQLEQELGQALRDPPNGRRPN